MKNRNRTKEESIDAAALARLGVDPAADGIQIASDHTPEPDLETVCKKLNVTPEEFGRYWTEVGRDNWRRTVYSALAETVPAERLLAGETLNPPGNWSSYPPHKHDRRNPPNEAVMEEIYFFRVRPAQGYGFIWTYTAAEDPEGFSTVFVVEDGDTVLLPKGYHPVVAAPGYELHYTWVLAGEERRYGAWADDPRHAWVKNQ